MGEPLTSPPAVAEPDDSVLAALHAFPEPEALARTLMAATARRPLTPNEKKRVRRAITVYCLRTEQFEPREHYSQHRPMTHLGVPPIDGFTADCSGHATGCFYWARKTTGLPVQDPNGLDFNGYGYTGTLLWANRDRRIPEGRHYFVGDLAIYGPATATRHVVTCRKGGTAATATWTSHGSERGPYPVRLHYRSDLLGVYRPWSLR